MEENKSLNNKYQSIGEEDLVIEEPVKEEKLKKEKVKKEKAPKELGHAEKGAAFMQAHFSEGIRVSDVAKYLHMNSNYFSKLFKRYTGVSPMQYITNLRLTNAMNLIENTDYNISQIAYAVGYDNPSYFRRLFRKYVGLSPAEYKKKKRM